LQRELGPGLEGVGSVEKMCLRGHWAEVLMPTSHGGDKANLRIILMRFPGGAYHAVGAGLTDVTIPGGRIRHAMMSYRELENAVYAALGMMDKCHISGGIGRRGGAADILVVGTEAGELTVQVKHLPSWDRFHARLTDEMIWLWDDTWELQLANRIDFEMNNLKIAMADGSMTVQEGKKILIFKARDGQVCMEEDGEESLSSEFTLDLKTLEVRRGDKTSDGEQSQ
jgi:hypothetical protein